MNALDGLVLAFAANPFPTDNHIPPSTLTDFCIKTYSILFPKRTRLRTLPSKQGVFVDPHMCKVSSAASRTSPHTGASAQQM